VLPLILFEKGRVSGVGGFGFREFDKPAERAHAEAEPRSAEPADASLWEKVLRRTTEGDGGCASLSPAEREGLRAVARQYRGQPLTVQPVAAALVEAVLSPHLSRDPRMAEFWQVAYLHIAQTQMEDPAAHELLERFWSRLPGDQP
jgi:hypothetical protein